MTDVRIHGSVPVGSVGEVERLLREQVAGWYWFSHADADAPRLYAGVRRGAAAPGVVAGEGVGVGVGGVGVYYFPRDHAGCYAVRPGCGALSFDVMVPYPVSSNQGDDIELPEWSVLPVDLAVRIIREFMSSPERPTCVEWYEL